MTRIDYRWNFPDPVPESANANLASFSLPFRSILFRRGCSTVDDALSLLLPEKPSLPRELSLGHIGLACELIHNSLSRQQLIAVYGDYDTDGITATALLTLALQQLSAQVIPFIPNRIRDGYGLNKAALDHLNQQGVQLLITADNGIRSDQEVAYAKSLGMDVIITDHHQPPDPLPNADAIINPKIPGDPYPHKNLAGVGVAYKLVCGLADAHPEISPDDYLDLVAVGTIADIVPLTGENRYLVKQGLILINQHHRRSLSALIGAAGLGERPITASDISFQIAPRLNSSGRLLDADHLVPLQLLLSSDPGTCGNLAQVLEIHNDRRKNTSRSLQARLEDHFSSLETLPPILISLDAANDLGVAGIAAGHLSSKYNSPAIVGSVGEEFTTASCRSIPAFDITAALSQNRELFSHYGGHKLAAGFTINNQHLPVFLERITIQANCALSGLDLRPGLEIDAVVTLEDLDRDLHLELSKLEPTGAGNPVPLFAIQNVTARHTSVVGRSGGHLKMVIKEGTKTISAIAFGRESLPKTRSGKYDIAAYYSENVFRGKREFQLQIVDIKPVD